MKDFWSILTVSSTFSFFRLISLAGAVLAIPIITACSPDSSTDFPASTQTSVVEPNQQDSAQIEDSITNSYARLAAKRTDVCPKLIQKNRGSNIINRVSEVMVNDHCDYFLYLREGQLIAVNTNNSQIEALLIVPALHNFANGDYKVESFDKHVIRLAYNGADIKPERLNYNVKITVTD